MSLKTNEQIRSITAQPMLFIGGAAEKLKMSLFENLLDLNIEKYYFICPTDEVIRYAKMLFTAEKFQIIEDIQAIPQLESYHLLICGIELLSEDFEFIKKHKIKRCLIFAPESGLFKTSLERRYPTIRFIDSTFENFVYENTELNPIPEEQVEKRGYFVNRTRELDSYRTFVASAKRACKIVGMQGIGKQAFIDELKYNFGLNLNHFEIRLTDKSNTLLDDILIPLFNKLGVKYQEKNIKNNKISAQKATPEIIQLFKKFDSISNAKIIFYNIHDIYDPFKRRFFKTEIRDFFSLLINRSGFTKNKIYFVSNIEFDFSQNEENLTQIIKLGYIEPHYIKLIISQEFINDHLADLSQIARDIDDTIINDLVCGHPQIAKLFVRACLEVGIMEILNKIEYKQYFEESKIKYIRNELFKKAPLTEKEKQILSFAALFKNKIEVDFINRLSSNPLNDIGELRKRFLIESTPLKNGKTSHYVPALIQDYIIENMPLSAFEDNHAKIGHFFWDKAERLETTDNLYSYSQALYHFQKARDKTKENQLILRFKEKFLSQADDLYHNEQYQEALDYYKILQESLNKTQFNFYLKCASITNNQHVKTIFESGIERFPDDEFILTTWANHHLTKNNVEKAEEICLKLMAIRKDNYGINHFYAKILIKKKKMKEAKAHIEQWIAVFEAKNPRTENDEKQLAKFKELNTSITQKQEQNLLDSKLGNMKGDYFEDIVSKLLEHLFKNRAIAIVPKYKNGDDEYDFVITNPLTKEIIVVEAKGYDAKKEIILGAYDKEKGKYDKYSLNWFAKQQFVKFKKTYQNAHNFQFKWCYITTANFTAEALNELDSLQKSSKEKPSEMDFYYNGHKLVSLLEKLKLKDSISTLKRHFSV